MFRFSDTRCQGFRAGLLYLFCSLLVGQEISNKNRLAQLFTRGASQARANASLTGNIRAIVAPGRSHKYPILPNFKTLAQRGRSYSRDASKSRVAYLIQIVPAWI